MGVEVFIADYKDPLQAQHIGYLLDSYARDQMGGGEPLPQYVVEDLAKALSERPYAFSVLAYVDGEPAGLVNCFEAFSTFKCQPLINIHDVAVSPDFRGMGVSQIMLDKVEEVARDKGCCKVTLEVLEGNEVAQKAYLKYGFSGYQLDPEMGKAMFWQKVL